MLGKSVFAIAMFASTSAIALSDIHLQFDNESTLTADQQTKALKIFAEITGSGCPGLLKYQTSIDRIVLTFDDDLDQPKTPWGGGKAYYDARFEEYGWTSALNMSVYLKSGEELNPDFKMDNWGMSSFSVSAGGERPGIIVTNSLSNASIVCGFPPVDTIKGHRFAPIPELQGLLDQ